MLDFSLVSSKLHNSVSFHFDAFRFAKVTTFVKHAISRNGQLFTRNNESHLLLLRVSQSEKNSVGNPNGIHQSGDWSPVSKYRVFVVYSMNEKGSRQNFTDIVCNFVRKLLESAINNWCNSVTSLNVVFFLSISQRRRGRRCG